METIHDDDDLQVDETTTTTTYQVRSTVLGKVVLEVSSETGRRGFVYLGSEVIAWQLPDSEAPPTVNWEHRDPSNASFRTTPIGAGLKDQAELDPLGTNAGTSNATASPSVRKSFKYPGFGDYSMRSDSQCTVDGFMTPCSTVFRALGNGSAEPCPDNNCGPRVVYNPTTKSRGFSPLVRNSAGQLGYWDYENQQRNPDYEGTAANGDPIEGVSFDLVSVFRSTSSQFFGFGFRLESTSYFFGFGQRGRPVEHRADQADVYVTDCRVIAMLDAIAWAEGTTGDADDGYGRVVRGTVLRAPNNPELIGQSNVTITDFTRHPNILVQVRLGLNSTAAGRYQFLHGTWTGFNLPDFGAGNQDLGAVILLVQAGSINPLLRGDVRQAAANANGTWASLPNSPYGQPTRAMEDFQATYDDALTACQNRPAHAW